MVTLRLVQSGRCKPAFPVQAYQPSIDLSRRNILQEVGAPGCHKLIPGMHFGDLQVSHVQAEAMSSAALREGTLRTSEVLDETFQRDALPQVLGFTQPDLSLQLNPRRGSFPDADPGKQIAVAVAETACLE